MDSARLSFATQLGAAGLLALTAVGSVSCSSDGGADGDITVVRGKVTVVVESAHEETSVGPQAAGPGKSFVVIRAEIGNGLSAAISVSPLVFRLRTTNGLEIVATPVNTGLSDQCPSNSLLAAVEGLACSLAFQVDAQDAPTHLIWAAGEEPAPSEVEAVISDYRRCERCGGNECVRLQLDSFNCGSCGTEVAVGNVCVNGTERVLEDREDCGADHAVCFRKENPATVGFCLDSQCVDLRTGEGETDRSTSTCDELCAEYGLSCTGRFGVRNYNCAETNTRDLQYASCSDPALDMPDCEHVYTGCDCS